MSSTGCAVQRLTGTVKHAAAKHPPDFPVSQTTSHLSESTSADTPVLRRTDSASTSGSTNMPRRSSTSDAIPNLDIPLASRKIVRFFSRRLISAAQWPM